MKHPTRLLSALLFALAMSVGVSACDNDDDLEDKVEDAADKIEDKAEEIEDKID